MQKRILVTGSEGLIGSAIIEELDARGIKTNRLDINTKDPANRGDVRDYPTVERAMAGCSGVVHLAAVSRVIWGEQLPELCWETNVTGTKNVLNAASRMNAKPWVVFSSSREVYGHPKFLPASEDAPLAPVNIYGRSKAAGEELINLAQSSGLTTAIVRFSNVYGSTADHADRVVPAFARAASLGEPLRVDGLGHIFDFNHLDDTVRGLAAITQALEQGTKKLPPIHFVTGTPTTLGELATMAIELAQSSSSIVPSTPRSYDVARFIGNPSRAQNLLGWAPRIGIREGLKRLIQDFRDLERQENEQGSAA